MVFLKKWEERENIEFNFKDILFGLKMIILWDLDSVV